jgi:DNA-binding response OmpR family regulator
MDTLSGRRILVVEDEYFIGLELADALSAIGAIIHGPFGSVDHALNEMAQVQFDFAILDINLNGSMSFVVAERLAQREVPFIFVTGYEPAAVPEIFAGARIWQKPFDITALLAHVVVACEARDARCGGSRI